MSRAHLFLGLAGSLLLSACGGGGGGGGSDDIPPPQNTTSQYTVSTSIETGGSISPDSTTASSGEAVTFSITPEIGYKLSEVSGCDGSLDGFTYTTGAVTASCQVAVTFEQYARAVPAIFTIDSANRKLIGQIHQFPTGPAWSNPFVVWGLDDDSYEIISVPDDFPYCGLFALDAPNNEIICPALNDGRLKFTALELDTGLQRILLDSDIGIDPAEWMWTAITDFKMSVDNKSLYLIVVYHSVNSSNYEDNKSVIFRYDLADSVLTRVVDGNAQSGVKVAAESLSLADSGILAIKSDFAGAVDNDDSLLLVDYSGQDAKSVSDQFNLHLKKIDIAEGSGLAYMAGYYGIAKSDINTGIQEVLSLESEEQLFNINQLGSAVLDSAASRLLVGDSSFDYILAVDTETGERSEFAAYGIGSGKRLMAPRAIELDEANQRAFVLDDGGSANEVLFEVDLVTGDRSAIARFDLSYNYSAQDLVLDISGGRVFAIFEHAVFSVALVDGIITPLVGSSSSSYQFTGGSLDEVGNRLLLTDASTDSVLALDLASTNISGVYSSPNIDTPVDVELDDATGMMYILSQGNGEIQSYDPATGEAKMILDGYSCPSSNSNIGMSHGLDLDPSQPWIWISGDELMRFNIDAGTCEVMPWKYYGYGLYYNIGILDAEVTSEGKLYGTQFNYVVEIDFESGELKAVSR